jgi:Legume lectin domain/Chitobiase/beta-hexosaminidase C-terminal domain
MLKRILQWACCALFLLLSAQNAPAQQSILTQHYDNARTGQNTNEVILTPPNVNSSTFGKLFALPVQGYVYAQPLYVPNVEIPGQGTHNVLYVATEHDILYAFDADSGGAPLWQVNFLINGATTLTPADVGNTQDINPEIGITGTPVIDPATNTLYVVVNTKENGALIDRLHALDITTGAEKFGGPVQITGSVPGTAPDGNGTNVPFNVQWANQRPGLLLINGFVYIGFSSHGDNGPWHGWLLGYDATTLKQKGIWCTSPNGRGNGIWGAGSGVAADVNGNAYVATGNGDDTVTTPAPPPSTTIDYGDSIVRVSLNNGVPIPTDYFTPFNQGTLDSSDADLGSGGVLVVPDQAGPYPHILIQAGKQGRIYVVSRDKMTNDGSHYCNGCTSDPEIVQTVNGIGGLWSMPAYWNGNIYTWGNGDHLKAFSLTAGTLSVSPTSESSETSGFPGSTPVVSSSGASDGIVWAVESDAYTSNGPAILRAYDATRVSTLLYASNLTGGRDTLGPAVKFVVPVVTNGKVYVGTQGEVDVFGLTNGEARAAAPVFNPPGGSYGPTVQVSMTSTTPNSSIYYTTDGSAPSTASTLYTGPISLSVTTTINAVAIANGFIQSATSTATYIISSQTAQPIFSPAPGTYVTAQSVSLMDGSPNAVIYYTTNGTTPTHSSMVYTKPIMVSATTTIETIASSPSLNDSPVVTGVYTINPNGTTSINFGLGFSNPGCMQFNGSTDLDDSRLQLTNGGMNEAGSAFCNTPVDVRGFSTDFTFQLSNAAADGITFTIQNSPAGPGALGPGGGGLGYGPDTPGQAPGIGESVAVKYDLYSNAGEGPDSTGLYTDGASPTVPSTDITASGVDLHSGDTMSVHMTYDGVILTMTITDTSVNESFTKAWPVNIPSLVGGDNAYVGFTGGTGGQTASQKIETWTFVSFPPTPQQWTFVTTSETAPNVPPLTDSSGNPFPCGSQDPDNINDSNPNCYNPLIFTTDWKASDAAVGGTTYAVMPNSLTNSGCSASGNVTNMSVIGYLPSGSYSTTVTMTLDNGATIVFTGSPSTDNSEFSGTFASTGSCMAGDSGTFTATLFPAVNGSYTGSFESTTGPSASVQMNLATDSNFDVTGTVTPVSGANVCFSSMTVASLTARAYGPSMASGDVLEAFASDNAGNVVAFLLSNTDKNGQVLAKGGLYVTYFGIAGACNGISGTDVPFRKTVRGMRPRLPVHPRRVARHSPLRPPDFRRWERVMAPVVHRPASPNRRFDVR